MKQKLSIVIIILMVISTNGFSQRFERWTSLNSDFKRHFTYTIEGGYVDNLPRHFIAGNESDYLSSLSGARVVQGNSIAGTNIFLGGARRLLSTDKILLTDFIVPQQENDLYAYGTGIYYPNGPNDEAFVFFGKYERRSMIPVSVIYYDLLYPNESATQKGNTAGTRIKYSKRENAYYISGVMADDVFVDMNFNEIQGKSKGFILKIDPAVLQARVLVIESDILPPHNPQICSVNDMEIDLDQKFLYFTGVTSKADFTGYTHPMVGKTDLNLNVIWCNSYEMPSLRFSGIDVEMGDRDQSIFVLMNSEEFPFSVMELDPLGNVVQSPQLYDFKIRDCNEPTVEMYPGAARGHIMHFTENRELIVTGNCFIAIDGHNHKQHLFSYKIRNASDLQSGENFFSSYSCQPKPTGAQIAVTSWWAPENSLYENGNLALVGHCIYDQTDFGYVYINTQGYLYDSATCYQEGSVQMKRLYTNYMEQRHYFTSTIKKGDVSYLPNPWSNIFTTHCIAPDNKSQPINQEKDNSGFQFKSISNTGILATLNSGELTRYQINVFDITGRIVYSTVYDVNGQMDINLKFPVSNQLYMISVFNGKTTESYKVSGVK